MSQSNLQVLLHASELKQMVDAVKYTAQTQRDFVGGCLFGLWRNSLKQPVIQFVTGPSKGFQRSSSVKDIFYNQYNMDCEEILFQQHAMLKLGYWFAGTDEAKVKAKDIFLKSSDDLLLFMTVSDNQELSVEYLLKKDDVERGLLCSEDVLSGHSSFRIYEPLTKQIKKIGAQYSTKPSEENDLINFSKRIQQLPSRTEVRDPETKKEQWYSSEDGMQNLQKLFQYLNEASIQVDMSRDATTHNIQFNLNSDYCLDFPVDFPRQMPSLSDHHGTIIPLNCQFSQDVDICRTVVDAVSNSLFRRAGGRFQRGGKHR